MASDQVQMYHISQSEKPDDKGESIFIDYVFLHNVVFQ